MEEADVSVVVDEIVLDGMIVVVGIGMGECDIGVSKEFTCKPG